MQQIAVFRRIPEVWKCERLTSQWLSLSLAYIGVTQLRFPFTLRLRTGESLVLQEATDLTIFWLVFVRSHYPVAAEDCTIVDVGANIGAFTLYAARTAPSARIISVEPFPDTSKRLTETITANHLEDRVEVANQAITGETGSVAMDRSQGVPSQYRSVLTPVPKMLNTVHKRHPGENRELGVSSVSLEDFLSGHHLEQVDLLKMNIHGNEYEVLLSSSPSVLRKIRRIALQYHEVPAQLGLGKQDIIGKLTDAGFRLASDLDTGRGSGRAVFVLEPTIH